MHFNKLIVEGQNAAKQEQALKFLQFITEYTLKKNQYRVLNPTLQNNLTYKQRNNKCDIMAQLNGIDWKKQTDKMNASQILDQQSGRVSWASQLKMQTDQDDLKSQRSSKKASLKNYESSQNQNSRIKQTKKILKNQQKKTSGFKKKKGQNASQSSSVLDNKSISSLNSDQFNNKPLQFSQSQLSQKYCQDLDDFQSYISSVVQQKKKTISVVNEQDFEDISQSYLSKISKNNKSHISNKSSLSNNNQSNIGQKSSFLYPDNQLISDYLLKLQTFDVQQEMIVKRISNTLSKPMACFQKMNKLKWSDLNLLKPSYKFTSLLNYAEVIE